MPAEDLVRLILTLYRSTPDETGRPPGWRKIARDLDIPTRHTTLFRYYNGSSRGSDIETAVLEKVARVVLAHENCGEPMRIGTCELPVNIRELLDQTGFDWNLVIDPDEPTDAVRPANIVTESAPPEAGPWTRTEPEPADTELWAEREDPGYYDHARVEADLKSAFERDFAERGIDMTTGIEVTTPAWRVPEVPSRFKGPPSEYVEEFGPEVAQMLSDLHRTLSAMSLLKNLGFQNQYTYKVLQRFLLQTELYLITEGGLTLGVEAPWKISDRLEQMKWRQDAWYELYGRERPKPRLVVLAARGAMAILKVLGYGLKCILSGPFAWVWNVPVRRSGGVKPQWQASIEAAADTGIARMRKVVAALPGRGKEEHIPVTLEFPPHVYAYEEEESSQD